MLKTTVNVDQINEYAELLSYFSMFRYARATRTTINNLAAEHQKLSRKNLDKYMIVRVPFTRKSIIFEKTNTLKIVDQASKSGSFADYMARQETGGVARTKGKHGIPIPTTHASNEGDVPVRLKRVIRSNRLKNIKLHKTQSRAKTQKIKNAILIREAIERKKRFVFLKTDKVKGFFRIKGGKIEKRTKTDKEIGIFATKAKINLIYNLNHDTLITNENPWLRGNLKEVDKRFKFQHYEKALLAEFNRAGFQKFEKTTM